MKTRNIVIALIILCVLAGLQMMNQSRRRQARAQYVGGGFERILPAGIDVERVDRIRIYTAGGQGTEGTEGTEATEAAAAVEEAESGAKPAASEIVLERREKEWVVTSYYDAPAQKQKVDDFLRDLVELEGELRAAKAEVLADFGLAEGDGIHVELRDRGTDKGYHVVIGKAGPNYNSGFVRRADGSQVYIVAKNLRSAMGLYGEEEKAPEAKPWLELAMLKLTAEEIKAVRATTPYNELEVERQEVAAAETAAAAPDAGAADAAAAAEPPAAPDAEKKYEWVLVQPADRAFELKQTGVTSWLSALARVDASDILAPVEDEAQTGLAEPDFALSVTLTNGTEKVIHIGKEIEGKAGDRYARIDGGKMLYSMPQWRLRNIFRKAPDLFDLHQEDVAKETVTGLAVKTDQGEVAFARESATADWVLTDAALPFKARKTKVDGILNALAMWKSGDIVGKDRPDLFGLDAPAAVVTLKLGEQERRYEIGSQVPGTDSSRFIRVSGVDQVLVLPDYKYTQINVSPIDAVEATLIDHAPDSVRRIELHDGAAPVVLTRGDDAAWSWQQGDESGPANRAKAQQVAQAVTRVTPVAWWQKLTAAEAGLESPPRRAVVTWKEGESEATAELAFGTRYGPGEVDQYVALAGVPAVLGCTASLAERVFVPLADLQQADAPPAPAGAATIDDGALPLVRIETDKGPIELELFEEDAPNTVANFISLAEKGYYDGLAFHRVIEGFMIQGGDPKGDGTGGPGYTIADEISAARKHERGTLSMANAGPNTGGSQFFICREPQPHLDGKHAIFGTVTTGQEVVDAIAQGDRMNRVVVLRKRGHPYQPAVTPEVGAAPEPPPPAGEVDDPTDLTDLTDLSDQSEPAAAGQP